MCRVTVGAPSLCSISPAAGTLQPSWGSSRGEEDLGPDQGKIPLARRNPWCENTCGRPKHGSTTDGPTEGPNSETSSAEKKSWYLSPQQSVHFWPDGMGGTKYWRR